MQALAHSFGPRALGRRLPTLALSLVVAELFFKLGSFTFECLAFLLTWFVLDGLVAWLTGARAADPTPRS